MFTPLFPLMANRQSEKHKSSTKMLFSHIIYIYCSVLAVLGSATKITFIATEHPNVSYFNPKYLSYINLTSRRYSRLDPRYYVGLHFDSVYYIHNNITLDFYFYEFLSNRYRRGFVEMHYKLCDLIHKDLFFGSAMRQGKFAQPCPFPNGDYHLYNMTIPVTQIPNNFPFSKGRIYCNVTSRDTHEPVAFLNIDMELKTFDVRKKN